MKRHDSEKEKYWMADYRYLTFPAFHAKMKDYIVLSCLAKGKSISATSQLTATKVAKVEELDANLKRGQAEASKPSNKGMLSCHKDKMTAIDWAFTYGMHTVLWL